MKKLNMFNHLDFDGFMKGKQLMSTGVKQWTDHDTGEILGTKVETVIVKDKTDYGVSKTGEQVSNLFEKIVFKVPKQIEVPMNVEVIPVNVDAKVYGDYHDKISATAEDIQVVTK